MTLDDQQPAVERGAGITVGHENLRCSADLDSHTSTGGSRLRQDTNHCHQRPGRVHLGARAHDDVVAYLQHADVLVVPHMVTLFTDSLDPIKLYEYAAVGRPVVSTPVAGFRDSSDPRVLVVPASEVPAAVQAALADDDQWGAARVEHPVPDWSDRTLAMRAVLDRLGLA
jgi:glycosyltransferase involved in cell wall biosynthesis